MKKTIIITLILISSIILYSADTSSISPIKNTIVDFDFQNLDIKDVLRALANQVGVNIITENNVEGKVTLHLSQVPFESGLKILLTSNGFNYKIKEGNIIYVYKAKETTTDKPMVEFKNGLLSLEINEKPINDVIQEISAKTGMNIVVAPDIKGNINARLHNIDPELGLKTLIEMNGYQLLKEKNIYRINKAAFKPEFEISLNDDGNISINVDNADIANLIKTITKMSKINVLTFGKLHGKVDAHIDDIPVDDALKLVLEGTSFTSLKVDNVFVIYGSGVDKTIEGKQFTDILKLKYYKAEDAIKLIPKSIKIDDIKTYKEQNAIIMTGAPQTINEAKSFIQRIDEPSQQILLEAIIVEYSKDASKTMGFSFSGKMNDQEITVQPGSLSSGFKSNNNFNQEFNVSLQALVDDGEAEIKARPRIATLNGHKASINVTKEDFYKVTTPSAPSSGAPDYIKIEKIQSGIILNIQPWVSASGDIVVEIDIEVSNPSSVSGEGLAAKSTRSIQTTVRLKNGQMLTIGGIIQESTLSNTSGWPLLSQIPILNFFFSKSSDQNKKSELVIHITPTIINYEEGYSQPLSNNFIEKPGQ